MWGEAAQSKPALPDDHEQLKVPGRSLDEQRHEGGSTGAERGNRTRTPARREKIIVINNHDLSIDLNNWD